jgi:adenylate kinase family enzyme
MRVVVVGTSGSGKSTFAQKLAAATGASYIELDLLNWGPGWFDRSKETPEAFIATVAQVTLAQNWVLAGNYRIVRPLIMSRARDVVWLDLPRALVMRQVITRSIWRAAFGGEVFPGCREEWRRMLLKDHPIRWAFDTYHRRRETYTAMMADPAFQHLRFHRCRSRKQVQETLRNLTLSAKPAGPP